jgi:hypothetical protein
MVNTAVGSLIRSAYPDLELFGAPKGVDSDPYDVNAKAAGAPTRQQIMQMLRSITANRGLRGGSMRSGAYQLVHPLVLALGVGIFAQTPASKSAFEVASVKQNRSGIGRWGIKGNPGGFTATNATPEELINFAYALRQSEVYRERNDQLLGEPRWMSQSGTTSLPRRVAL